MRYGIITDIHNNVTALRAVMKQLYEFQKISGEFVAIGLVKISFPVEEIFTVELRESIPA